MWVERSGEVMWSDRLAKSVFDARQILERLDLAGIGSLEKEIRDEYDDIILVAAENASSRSVAPIQEWVEKSYGAANKSHDGHLLEGALSHVELALRKARINPNI